MDNSDAPRFFRAALTYHPTIGTFRGGRGAWRVEHSYEVPNGPNPIEVSHNRRLNRATSDGITRGSVLYMDVPRKLKDCTFCNPTVLLKILLEQRRATQEEPCQRQQSAS
jgi:hypothetical protein